MTHDNRSHLDRRTVLKSSGIALAGLGGLTSTVAARGNGNGGKRVSLLDGPAEFQLFWSGADGNPKDADDPSHFGYPGDPTDTPFDSTGNNGAFLGGEDGVDGLFDASEIEMTPKGQTLHHTLRFFQGFLMERNRGKPYTLTNEGLEPVSGIPDLPVAYRFVARGQHLNFDAVSSRELTDALSVLDQDSIMGSVLPLFQLTDSSWRAVGSEVVFVAPDEPTGEPGQMAPFSATRVDFYRRASNDSEHRGQPRFELSLVYIIYPDFDPGQDGKTGNLVFQSIPKTIHEVGQSLTSSGPRNLGGQ